jgi:hypothetical protein
MCRSCFIRGTFVLAGPALLTNDFTTDFFAPTGTTMVLSGVLADEEELPVPAITPSGRVLIGMALLLAGTTAVVRKQRVALTRCR